MPWTALALRAPQARHAAQARRWDLDALGACWSPTPSRSPAIARSRLPAPHAGLAASPGRAAVAPEQSSAQPRAAWQVDLPLEDEDAFEDLAADAGLSDERYGELTDFVEAPDGQDSVSLDAEGAEDTDTEAESEAESEAGSPGGRRGAADRLLERLDCELYLGAGPGKFAATLCIPDAAVEPAQQHALGRAAGVAGDVGRGAAAREPLPGDHLPARQGDQVQCGLPGCGARTRQEGAESRAGKCCGSARH